MTITYTPNAGFEGLDSFVYVIGDGGEAVALGIVTVRVLDVNFAPVVQDDPVEIILSDPLTVASVVIPVLNNDSDEDDSMLVVTGVTQPEFGRVGVNDDGTITYTPRLSFTNTDAFTYTVTDAHGNSTTGSVTLRVLLSAIHDTAITEEDTPVVIEVLSNDGLVLPGTVLRVTQGGHGSVIIDEQGKTVSYMPDADFNGVDRFTYTPTKVGLTGTAIVSVTVTSVSDVPLAVNDSSMTLEDTAVAIDVVANDDLVDEPAAVTAVTQGTHGAVAFDAPSGTTTYTPDEDFNGTDSYSYTITDFDGETSTAFVVVTVVAVNDVPAAADDTVTTDEDQ
jgi:hypothetical protein